MRLVPGFLPSKIYQMFKIEAEIMNQESTGNQPAFPRIHRLFFGK